MKQLSTDQEMWIKLITCAKGLFENTLLLIIDTNVFSLPFRFEGRIVCHNYWAEVLLQDYLALQLYMLRPNLELAIQRRSKDIRNRI